MPSDEDARDAREESQDPRDSETDATAPLSGKTVAETPQVTDAGADTDKDTDAGADMRTAMDADTVEATGPAEVSGDEPAAAPRLASEEGWVPGMLTGRTADLPGPERTGSAAAFFAASPGDDRAGAGGARTAAAAPMTGARAARGSMDRHRAFDPMSMIAGFFFMAIAVMYMLDAGDAVDARPGLMLALAVIGVGASGVVGAAWAAMSGRRAKRSGVATARSAVDLSK
jgi:hypothetical protein